MWSLDWHQAGESSVPQAGHFWGRFLGCCWNAQEGIHTNYPYFKPILEEASHFLRLIDWKSLIAATSREANKCANILAHRGHQAPFYVTIIDHALPPLSILVNDDNGGVCPPSISN